MFWFASKLHTCICGREVHQHRKCSKNFNLAPQTIMHENTTYTYLHVPLIVKHGWAKFPIYSLWSDLFAEFFEFFSLCPIISYGTEYVKYGRMYAAPERTLNLILYRSIQNMILNVSVRLSVWSLKSCRVVLSSTNKLGERDGLVNEILSAIYAHRKVLYIVPCLSISRIVHTKAPIKFVYRYVSKCIREYVYKYW